MFNRKYLVVTLVLMKRFLSLACFLFLVAYMLLTISTAKAEKVSATWGAIKNGSGIKAAPSTSLAKKVLIHYPKGKIQKLPGNDKKGKTGCGTDQYSKYEYPKIHWVSGDIPVHWSYDRANEKASKALKSIQASFDTWTLVEPAWQTTYDGQAKTGKIPVGERDGINSVCWRRLDQYPNAIAITIIWYIRNSKKAVEIDTYFKSTIPWSTTGALDAYDVQNIATHEFGHWLVLDDLYKNCTSELTMFGYSNPGEIEKRDLGMGDILGIQKIY